MDQTKTTLTDKEFNALNLEVARADELEKVMPVLTKFLDDYRSIVLDEFEGNDNYQDTLDQQYLTVCKLKLNTIKHIRDYFDDILDSGKMARKTLSKSETKKGE